MDELKLIRGVLAHMYGSLSAAHKVAAKAHMSIDDLYQVGRIAIWKAEQKYIHSEGGSLEGFAFGVIRFDILKELRRKGNMIHIPHAASFEKHKKEVGSLNIRVGEKENEEILNLIPGDPFDEDSILNKMIIEERLNRLSERDRNIVIKIIMNEMSQKDVGKEIGYSQNTVSKWFRAAIKQMKEEVV